jgi:hypothetical protein
VGGGVLLLLEVQFWNGVEWGFGGRVAAVRYLKQVVTVGVYVVDIGFIAIVLVVTIVIVITITISLTISLTIIIIVIVIVISLIIITSDTIPSIITITIHPTIIHHHRPLCSLPH